MLYKILPYDDSNGTVYLPLGHKFESGRSLSDFNIISAGLKKCGIKVLSMTDLKSDEIKISTDIINSLSIPLDIMYQVRHQEDTIDLGPVIGLLLDYKNKDLTENQLKEYLYYTLIYNQIGGLLYVFSKEGIDFSAEVIEGFYFNPGMGGDGGKWEKAVLPFPKSIFRRIFLPDSTIKRIQDATGERMFNNYFFSKLRFWNVANEYDFLREYIPETRKLKSIRDIDELLEKYDTLYLKPSHGSLGNGLVRVVKKDNQYILKEKSIEKPVMVYDRDDASKYITRISGESSYLVQQAVNLLKFEERYSDFRIIMQKDDTLNWQCTGIVISMGASGGICSNYKQGLSRFLSFEDFFSTFLSLSQEDIYRKKEEVVRVCKKVCKVLDLEMGNYGDVGIDIGIDRSLKLWIFEVNERHDHSMPILINDYQAYLAVKSNPVKYATALSGFSLI